MQIFPRCGCSEQIQFRSRKNQSLAGNIALFGFPNNSCKGDQDEMEMSLWDVPFGMTWDLQRHSEAYDTAETEQIFSKGVWTLELELGKK
jgi:hypothetical protein